MTTVTLPRPARISSGFPVLDSMHADATVGAWTPGKVTLIASDTGHGKSTHANTTAVAAAQDLRNYGLPHAKVLVAHCEEESDRRRQAMQLSAGQRHAHLADNVKIHHVYLGLSQAATAVYDLTEQARTDANDDDIRGHLPHVVIIEHASMLRADSCDSDSVTGTNIAAFCTALAAWDLAAIAKIAGVTYEQHTGSPLPVTGDHSVAVIAYASNTHRESKPSRAPAHPVNIRQYAQLAEAVDTVLLLWRDQPHQPVLTDDDGVRCLSDTGARVLVYTDPLAALDPATTPDVTVEMEFNSSPHTYGAVFVEVDSGVRRGDLAVPAR
jgi:hypothetical protein